LAIKEVKEAEHSIESLMKLLECHGLGGSFKLPRILKCIHNLELNLSDLIGDKTEENLMSKSVDSAILSVLRNLRTRARIPGLKIFLL
jgi:hypothetical protein